MWPNVLAKYGSCG